VVTNAWSWSYTSQMSADSSDEELLVSGGAQGFALLYELRYLLIRGYLRRRVGPHPELVLDLVAETFARALERREQARAPSGDPRDHEAGRGGPSCAQCGYDRACECVASCAGSRGGIAAEGLDVRWL